MSALIPIEQKQVVFYEDEITAVLVEVDGKQRVYIPLRPIVERLGLDWSAQYRRVNKDPVLSHELLPCVVVTATQGQPDQRREVICLPLDFLNGFLFGISAERVRAELREQVIRYQRECYRVLAEAFRDGRLPVTAESPIDELLNADTPAAQAYRLAHTIMQMARQQVIMEARIESHESRLELIEAQLGDESRTISESQAMQISQAVKLIGVVWSKEEKKNLYGAVFGRFYERFEITAYRHLPNRRFNEAMTWLREWYVGLAGDKDIPF